VYYLVFSEEIALYIIDPSRHQLFLV